MRNEVALFLILSLEETMGSRQFCSKEEYALSLSLFLSIHILYLSSCIMYVFTSITYIWWPSYEYSLFDFMEENYENEFCLQYELICLDLSIYIRVCISLCLCRNIDNVQEEDYTYYTRTWSHVHTKMCMFCGLYSWSLTHTLSNPNNKNSIHYWCVAFVLVQRVYIWNVHAQGRNKWETC